MGEVYRARDTRLDRTVAIKIVSATFGDRPEARQRFEREARAVSALSHPHVCPLFDVGEATLRSPRSPAPSPVAFLVMEFCDGETLGSRLARGSLPIDQVLRYAIEIASALDAADRQGIVHRDLKPGNVMLTKAGAKLLDFGLAKAVGPAKAGRYVRPDDHASERSGDEASVHDDASVRSVGPQPDLADLCAGAVGPLSR